MLSFAEYIAEATPEFDKKQRDDAVRIFNKLTQKLKSQKDSDNVPFKIVLYADALSINLGEVLKDSKYYNVELIFGASGGKYAGMFSPNKDGNNYIILYTVPQKLITKEFYTLNKLMPRKVLVRIMLEGLKSSSARSTFVHEFVHNQDFHRVKSKETFFDKGSKDKPPEIYYNDEKELNAHYQHIVDNVEVWFRQHFIDKILKYKFSVAKMNSYKNIMKNKEELESALIILSSMNGIYNRLNVWETSTRTFIDDEVIRLNTNTQFFKYLNQKNRKKIVARLYQYHTTTFKKIVKDYKKYISTMLKNVKNEDVIYELKRLDMNLYNDLVKIGLNKVK